jgi:hypothetical protein
VKRPIVIWFIAAWCFIALFYQSSTILKRFKPDFPEGQASAGWWGSLGLAADVFIIWHCVRLVQLKSSNRWISVGFFIFWCVNVAWNGFVAFTWYHASFRVIGALSVVFAINLASCWYLMRPSFRRFAVAFEAERRQRKHWRDVQRISEKLLQDEAKR